MVKMRKITRFSRNDYGYTLFELVIVLILIGVVSGGISSIFSVTQVDYEILAEAHNIKSTVSLLQSKAMQYFEQELYGTTEMRDDDLWGIQFLRNKTYRLVRKKFNSSLIDNLDIKGPVWMDQNIYRHHKNSIVYTLTNPCIIDDEIFFDALGKPVDRSGEQCKRNIKIELSAPYMTKKVTIDINKTGHVMITQTML
jgi:prepilin-type N-terminal cleavage/methylation domain-containing protein